MNGGRDGRALHRRLSNFVRRPVAQRNGSGPAKSCGRSRNHNRATRGAELERVRANPLELRDFLKRMPKGADLHSHLNGAVYAETLIRAGGQDGVAFIRKRSMGSLQRHSHLALVRRGRQIMTPANFRRKSSLSRRPPSTRRPAIRFVRLLHGMTADCEQDGYARLTRQAFSSAR